MTWISSFQNLSEIFICGFSAGQVLGKNVPKKAHTNEPHTQNPGDQMLGTSL